MATLFKKPYIYWIVLIFITYTALNIIFSGFYNTIKLIIIYANTVDWLKLGVSIILTLAIGFLVAVNSVIAYIKYKERKKCKEGIATAGVGTLGGLIVGVCPLCVTGLFPLVSYDSILNLYVPFVNIFVNVYSPFLPVLSVSFAVPLM